MRKRVNGILPHYTYIMESKYSGLSEAMRKFPEKFNHIFIDYSRMLTYNIELKTINKWILEYFNKNGKYPKVNNEKILGHEILTWQGLNLKLCRNRCGIGYKTSLSEIIKNNFNYTNNLNKENMTLDELHKHIKEYIDDNKKPPHCKLGKIEGTNYTWIIIENDLKRGKINGLRKIYKSLKNFLIDFKYYKKRINTFELDVENIKSEMVSFYKENKSFPTSRTKKCNSKGVQWRYVDQALRNGYRGLSRGSSLLKLKQEIRNDQKKKNT